MDHIDIGPGGMGGEDFTKEKSTKKNVEQNKGRWLGG